MRRERSGRAVVGLLLLLLLLLAPVADSAKRKKKKSGKKKSGEKAGPVERPEGILEEQWQQLDEEERRLVVEQVAAMHPPPPPPLVLEDEEDSSVVWEEWDTQDYSDAWSSLKAVVQEGGGEEELKAAVNELLGRGWRPVHAAARHGQMSELEMFLDFLEPLIERAELLRDQRGLTALHLAALSGHLDVMKRLLPQGKLRPKARAARVDPEDRHGSRPLHVAAGQGQVEAMRLLLRAGADPEAQTKGFARPLHVAASAGQMEAMRLLMSEEVRVNLFAEDATGASPLVVANKTDHPEAVEAIQEGVIDRARHLYETNMPEAKRGDFDELLEKHKGKEQELLELLEEVLLQTKKKLGVE